MHSVTLTQVFQRSPGVLLINQLVQLTQDCQHLLVGALVHLIIQSCKASCVAIVTCQHCLCITIIGVPGWVPSGALICSWHGMLAVYNHQVRTSWDNSSVTHCTLPRMSWSHLSTLTSANLVFKVYYSHSTWH